MNKKNIFIASVLVALFFSSAALSKTRLNPGSIEQGKTFALYLEETDLVSAEVTFSKKSFPFFRLSPKTWRALVPVPLELKPGQYPVLATLYKERKQAKYKEKITVEKGHFKRVHFNLPKKKKILFKRKLIIDEWAEIEKELLIESPAQAWEGTFAMPASGSTTLSFGTFELIDGKHSGRHRGTDIYSSKETKADVLAANNGRIVVAKHFNTFGNTAVISHGQNVFSIYFHLSKLYVNKGDTVNKKEVIGKIGTTGISTAPHLHFAVSVNNQRVDPDQWLTQEF